MTVKEAKSEVVKHFRELQGNEETKRKDDYDIGDEEHIRFRELFFKTPSAIFFDNVTIKEASRLLSPEIAIEKIPSGEIKVKGNLVIFIQQFFPSKYELGDVHVIATTNDEELDSLRNRITDLTGCNNVVLTLGDRWEYKILNIYNLNSYKPKSEDDNEDSSEEEYLKSRGIVIKNPTYHVRRLNLRDGEMVYFWDNKEELKNLTEEEKRSLMLKERSEKAKKSSYKDREEVSLHIKEKDVNIEDE